MTALRVLVVDDDAALLQALPEALRLRMSGVTVDTADSAAAALDRIAGRDYDAIVNVQGDEPLTRLEHLAALLAVMKETSVQVGTLMTPASEADIPNPNAVKVVTDAGGRALPGVGTFAVVARHSHGCLNEIEVLVRHYAGGAPVVGAGPGHVPSSDSCDIGDDLRACGLLSATISSADGVPTADSSRWSKQVSRG